MTAAKQGAVEVRCPHCRAKEPSVWDGVLFHWAHPDGEKLKFCHEPWRNRVVAARSNRGGDGE